jgi:putative hemolysin
MTSFAYEASTSMWMKGSPKYAYVFSAACGLAACSSPGDPPVPAMPSFATDVSPIFASHCTRCHGQGGTLNAAPNPDGSPNTVGAPSVCYLTMYDDAGDCSIGDGGFIPDSCQRGAHYCATPDGIPPVSYIETYAITLKQDEGGMPPLPWPPLSAHEKAVLAKWLQDPMP